jgi:NhaA family Na+:H+ antiporter
MLRRFFQLESASGILLLLAAILAMLMANSPLDAFYNALMDVPLAVRVADLEIAKPLLLWINDGLMAVFFFMVGLELKRELLQGHLRSPSQIVLPGIAAAGGMVIPALVYVAFNWRDPGGLMGWAIPTATDIAFAMGILALLGRRVPPALKIFLLTLAIFDDVGAIIIIALFYTSKLAPVSLLVAASALVALFILNRAHVTRFGPYLLVGIILWVSVLKSGVHATLAGVAFALFIPLHSKREPDYSPAKAIEHDLHPWVSFGILPLFAFANAGVSLAGVSVGDLFAPIPLGIAAGLFIGKQLGVFLFSWLAIRTGLAKLPEGTTWPMIYGVAIICGIGFTMSLFIAGLAFEQAAASDIMGDRLGILLGSLTSAILGYGVLHWALKRSRRDS